MLFVAGPVGKCGKAAGFSKAVGIHVFVDFHRRHFPQPLFVSFSVLFHSLSHPYRIPENPSRQDRVPATIGRQSELDYLVAGSVSCRLLGGSFRRGLGPSHGASLQFDTVRIVEEAIADSVGLVRVANDVVPVGDRELAGNQDGGAFATFLDDFDQVPAFRRRAAAPGASRRWPADRLGQPGQESGVRAVATADRHLVQEPGMRT